jgi:hypothetical protein
MGMARRDVDTAGVLAGQAPAGLACTHSGGAGGGPTLGMSWLPASTPSGDTAAESAGAATYFV